MRERLGAGARGTVWEGHRIGNDESLAIKLLKIGDLDDPESVRRFLREAKAAASIDHEGVVKIIDADVDPDGVPFLVMERVAGETVAEALARTGPLPWDFAAQILIQLAEALEAVHAAGIVHRDLKPSNVMLVAGSEVRCKLIDFGLACAKATNIASSLHTETGNVLGTPAYMSPEQLSGHRVGPAADVYSLGCMAYELMSGRRPFSHDNVAATMLHHLTKPPPPLAAPQVPKQLHKQVEALVLRALRKRPEHRFESARAFAAAVRDVAPGRRPVFVPRELTDDLTSSRPGRDSRTTIFVAVGVAVALGAGAAGVRALESSQVDALAVDDSPPPLRGHLGSGAPIAQVVAGANFNCALSTDGAAKCWGTDDYGSLGRGTNGIDIGDDELPAEVAPLDFGPDRKVRALRLESGSRFACAIFTDDTATCWGGNQVGMLGRGNVTPYGDDANETLVNLPSLPLAPVHDLATGHEHVCALAGPNKDVYCWGDDSWGQLGRGGGERVGDDEAIDALTPVVLDTKARALAVGWDHTCALGGDAKVRCWGDNRAGQLGRGDISSGSDVATTRPSTPVAGLGRVVVLAAADERTCVLDDEDEVRCWGSNAGGALGYRSDQLDGCASDSDPRSCRLAAPLPEPLDLGADDGAHILDLQLGHLHGCVLDDRGRIRCWGSGLYGRLGYGVVDILGHAKSPAQAYAEIGTPFVDVGDFDEDGRPDAVRQLALGNRHTCVLTVLDDVRCWGSGNGGRLGYGTTETIGDDETPAAFFARLGGPSVPLF